MPVHPQLKYAPAAVWMVRFAGAESTACYSGLHVGPSTQLRRHEDGGGSTVMVTAAEAPPVARRRTSTRERNGEGGGAAQGRRSVARSFAGAIAGAIGGSVARIASIAWGACVRACACVIVLS